MSSPSLPPPPSNLASLATKLKNLHVPGKPLLLANVWDASSATTIASLPQTSALATASYAIAMMVGVADADLTLAQNLLGTEFVVRGLQNSGRRTEIPLSADLQDGYSDPAETIRKAVGLGVVGANIEDSFTDPNAENGFGLRSIEENCARIKLVLATAADLGVSDFVVNARTDAFGKFDGSVSDVVRRGKAYLEAGATTVFVWGVGTKLITEEEVKQMVEAFGGRLAVQPGGVGTERLRALGVSRVSVGPMLWRKSIKGVEEQGVQVLES